MPEAARMRICVYEDRHVRSLEPLTLTRPAVDLLCGLTTLGEKQVRYFAATAVGHLCRPVMAGLVRACDPHARVNDPAWLRGTPTGLVNARWVPPLPRPRHHPPFTPRRHLAARAANPFADAPYLGTANGAVAFVVLDTKHLEAVSATTLDDCLDNWARSLPAREVGGTVISRPWELIDLNGPQIERDF